MTENAKIDGAGRSLLRNGILLVIAVASTTCPALGRANNSADMPESIRASVKKVVVLPGTSPAGQEITGSYEKETPGLAGGLAKGSQIGKGVSKDIGGIGVSIPIPILTVPGALIGGISGATKREIQEFRDRLTDDLVNAASQPLTNDAIASDVFWGFKKIPGLDPKILTLTAAIPEDTDAVLYVSLSDVTIDVQGVDAIITTSARATLRRVNDGQDLYDNLVHYQDRDSLENWTRNENALWRDYANFARYYIGREISAQVFERADLQHELRPQKTSSVKQVKKNVWQGVSREAMPVLAWELTQPANNPYGPWTATIDEPDITYEIEIFDLHRPVYSARNIREPRHTVSQELDGCKTYRWSVRPSYRINGDTRFGEWMRVDSGTNTGSGSTGKKASAGPAYIHDFASLEIKCGRR